jgi:hypothetical protein
MNVTLRTIVSGWISFSMFAGIAAAQGTDNSMPRIIEKDGRHALLVDGKPFFMFGGQAHNSSAWPAMLPRVWQAASAMRLNTLEIPIYWEQIEPQPGRFDFSLVDLLLKEAREHNVRLVLLWFGTWKNGSNHYIPEWMKRDSARFPNITGRNGRPVDSPSPHCEEAMQLDTKAFTAVMTHLKQADPQHTVIMVQVENEPGSWGSVRDFSPKAQQLFEQPVPAEMLKPELLKALNRPTDAKGTWQEVFGKDADEYFHAYSIAHYVGQVAAAGKTVNPLPLYVNVALRDPLSNPPATSYESGGATDNVIPIYKVAAPAVDVIAPDIYQNGDERYMKVLELYNRPDNALFVPETSGGNVRYVYTILERGGIGFSPFGIDAGSPEPIEDPTAVVRPSGLGREYAVLAPMAHELATWGFEGKIKFMFDPGTPGQQTFDLGEWQAVVTFNSGGGGRGGRGGGRGGRGAASQPSTAPVAAAPAGATGARGGAGAAPGQTGEQPLPGRFLVAKLGEGDFVIIASSCSLTFRPTGANAGKAWQFLKVEEGQYENGTFKLHRIRNGDETDFGGPRYGATPVVTHITLTVR